MPANAFAGSVLPAALDLQSKEAPHFFAISCLSAEDSPDARCKLELRLEELSAAIRDEPTVPADGLDEDMPSREALLEDSPCAWVAVQTLVVRSSAKTQKKGT